MNVKLKVNMSMRLMTRRLADIVRSAVALVRKKGIDAGQATGLVIRRRKLRFEHVMVDAIEKKVTEVTSQPFKVRSRTSKKYKGTV